jgi:hypothetical protein
MHVKVIRRFTSFADYPRFEYILKMTGVLNNLYLGTTFPQAIESINNLKEDRKRLGLPEIFVEFVN